MNRARRKFITIASDLYRKVGFPFKRRRIEKQTDSIILSGAYLYGDTVLEGRNYVGKGTELNHVRLGFGSYVNNGGMLTNTQIGRYTSIGPGVKSVIGRHPVSECASTHPAFYSADAAMGFTYTDSTTFEETVWTDKEKNIQIVIGSDVWIGNDVSIMEGVTIGDGAVIAAGAIVTKDVEPYAVMAGVPAKMIRKRFSQDIVDGLTGSEWWNKSEKWLRENHELFKDPLKLIEKIGSSASE